MLLKYPRTIMMMMVVHGHRTPFHSTFCQTCTGVKIEFGLRLECPRPLLCFKGICTLASFLQKATRSRNCPPPFAQPPRANTERVLRGVTCHILPFFLFLLLPRLSHVSNVFAKRQGGPMTQNQQECGGQVIRGILPVHYHEYTSLLDVVVS